MRIQTRGYSNNVWLSSDEGVIDGTMILSAPTLEKILQAVNEKYGTSFEGWSQLPAAYEVGDNVPNWNAYEKIEMSHFNIAVAFGNVYLFGHVDGHVYTYSAKEDGGGFPANANGIIQEGELTPPQSELYEGFIQTVKTKLSDYNVTTVTWESKSYQQGDQIENWEDYIKV